jgi:probable phosphoglycerate mutase
MKVLLVRHGETAWNKVKRIQGKSGDVSLTDTGKEQARAVLQHIPGELRTEIRSIVHSGLKRAEETALEIQSQLTGTRLLRDPDWQEMSYGSFEGSLFSECRQDLEHIFELWKRGDAHMRCPGEGESPKMVLERVERALRGLMILGEPVVLVVAHGSCLRMLLSRILLGPESFPASFFSIPSLPNASVTLLHVPRPLEEDWSGVLVNRLWLEGLKSHVSL